LLAGKGKISGDYVGGSLRYDVISVMGDHSPDLERKKEAISPVY